MTNKEAKEKLEAMLECMCKSFSGINEDCNRDMCETCNLCYTQGTVAEQEEALRIAISILKKQIPMKIRIEHEYPVYGYASFCPNCNRMDVGGWSYCPNCGQAITMK